MVIAKFKYTTNSNVCLGQNKFPAVQEIPYIGVRDEEIAPAIQILQWVLLLNWRRDENEHWLIITSLTVIGQERLNRENSYFLAKRNDVVWATNYTCQGNALNVNFCRLVSKKIEFANLTRYDFLVACKVRKW